MEAGKWVMACTLLLYRIVSNLVLDKLLGDISQGRPRCSLCRFLYIFFSGILDVLYDEHFHSCQNSIALLLTRLLGNNFSLKND